MGSFSKGKEIEQFGNIVPPVIILAAEKLESISSPTHLILASPLSSLKLARIAALSFCTTARSSAMVFEARTLRMNCFTETQSAVIV